MVEHAENAPRGLACLMGGGCDVALVAHELHDTDGLSLIRDLGRRGVETPTILMAAAAVPGLEIAAIDAGAADFLDKEELDVGRLERAISLALTRQRRAARHGQPQLLDPLTGLLGRHAFLDRLEHALARTRRRGCSAAMVLLDIDGFQRINREFGMAAGDSLLRLVAGRLRRQLRASDTAARLGADRFGVVLEDLARPDHGGCVAQKLIAALETPVAIAGETVAATVSAGVTILAGDGVDAVGPLMAAETALRAAKLEGGGRCRFAPDRQTTGAADAMASSRALRRALHADELTLLFQPQVTLTAGELGLAAMVRWQDEEGAALATAELQDLADATALTEPLADWILHAVCRQASRWRVDGLPSLHVAVPLLSRRQLAWSDLPRRMERELAQSGMPPAGLELEIEETLLLDQRRQCSQALGGLVALGVRLAMSDFGCGLTSLELLRDLPLSTVKLSRGTLEGVPQDAMRTAFVAAIVGLAKELRLRIVADGAETQGQLQLLRQLGCDAVQSLVCCPPLPASACTDWLREAHCRT